MSGKAKSLLDIIRNKQDALVALLTVSYFVASAQNYNSNKEKQERARAEAHKTYHLEGGGILECRHCEEQKKYQNL